MGSAEQPTVDQLAAREPHYFFAELGEHPRGRYWTVVPQLWCPFASDPRIGTERVGRDGWVRWQVYASHGFNEELVRFTYTGPDGDDAATYYRECLQRVLDALTRGGRVDG